MKIVKIVPMHGNACNCEACKNVPVSNDKSEDLSVPVSGVNFPGVNVYTADNRVITTKADVYNNLFENAMIAAAEINEFSDPKAKEFYLEALGNVVATNICVIVDRFMNVLYNLYGVFASDVKNIGLSIVINTDFIDRNDLARSIVMYIDSPESNRKYYDFVSYTMAYIVKSFTMVYNDARRQLDSYIVGITKSDTIGESDIKDAYDELDKYFRKMCGNATFEVTRYCECIKNGEPLMLNAEQAAMICNLVSSKDSNQ